MIFMHIGEIFAYFLSMVYESPNFLVIYIESAFYKAPKIKNSSVKLYWSEAAFLLKFMRNCGWTNGFTARYNLIVEKTTK